MIIFPYKKVVIETEMSEDDIVMNLKDSLTKKAWLRFHEPERYENSFKIIDKNNLEIINFSTYYRRPKIQVLVNIQNLNTNSFVTLKVKWNNLGLFSYIYILFFSIIAIIIFTLSINQQSYNWFGIIISPIFILLPYMEYFKSFYIPFNYIQSEFLSLLNGKLCKK